MGGYEGGYKGVDMRGGGKEANVDMRVDTSAKTRGFITCL